MTGVLGTEIRRGDRCSLRLSPRRLRRPNDERDEYLRQSEDHHILLIFYINLLSINDIQSLLQATEPLTLEVVDKFVIYHFFFVI